MKVISKEQFLQMAMPTKGDGKEIVEAKMELKPVNRGVINGNTYLIKVNDLENTVELKKIEEIKEEEK
jgi:hypothetical protein